MKIRKEIIFFQIVLAFFFANIEVAQSNRIDSLEMVLMENKFELKTYQEKVEIYLELSELYKATSIDKSLDYAKRSLELAEENNNEELIYKSNYMLADVCYLKHDYLNSIRKFEVVLENTNEDNAQKGDILYKLAKSLNKVHNFKESIILLFKLLDLAEKLKDPYLSIRAHLALGAIYLKLKAYDQAELEFNQSNEILKKIKNKDHIRLESQVNNNLALVFEKKGDLSRAEGLFKKSIDDLREKNYESHLIHALKNYAEFLNSKVEFDESIIYINEALELSKKSNNSLQLSDLYGKKAYFYYLQKDYEKSLEYNKEALSIRKQKGLQFATQSSVINCAFDYLALGDTINAKKLLLSSFNYSFDKHFNEIRERASKVLSEIYEAENDFFNSLKFSKYYIELMTENSKKLQNIDIKNSHLLYKFEKVKADKLEYSTKLQRLLNIVFVSIGILAFVFVIYVYKSYKNKKKQNEVLTKEKELLKVNLSEITRSKQEISSYKTELEKQVNKRTKELETANKKLNKLLEKEKVIGELKTNFLNMISHEYRTPLTIIFSSIEIIERVLIKTPNIEIESYIKRIKGSLKLMTDLLDDVLFSKAIEENEHELEIREIGVDRLVEKLTSNFSEQSSHQINIYNSLEFDSFNTDKLMIYYILNQLIENAVKYSPSAQKVDVYFRNDEENMIVKVVDYGIGISDEDLDKIEEPLYRGANVSNISGFGLGLYNVFKCVKMLDGKLNISSKLNYGSTFELVLPLIKSNDAIEKF